MLDVVRSAFAGTSGGAEEVDLVSWVWSSDAHLPDLDLVAVDAHGDVVGHVLHAGPAWSARPTRRSPPWPRWRSFRVGNGAVWARRW